ncbi:MAG: alpha/beta hydrolase [Candidatus Eremiobacteraeota bacterium]|nr:alpha/beta hydrolase [Candidatus Eremiobacteraeota bacterium]
MHLPSGGALHVDGPAGAVPVLFLHGAGGGAWSWRPQRAAFASSWRLFFWEARGHGAAAKVADAGVADYYLDAKEALAEVVEQTRRPAFVVAHSLGGFFALALAANVAGGIAGLFLIEPAYSTGREPLVRIWRAIAPLARVAYEPLMLSVARDGSLGRAVVRRRFAGLFEDRAKMEAAWQDQQTQRPFEYPRVMREAFSGPQDFKMRDFAQDVADPTFLLERDAGGRRSRYGRLTRTLAERLGDQFTHEAIRGGHYLQLDSPERVNERIRRFVEGSGR